MPFSRVSKEVTQEARNKPEHALTKTELGRRVLYLGQWAISPESDALCNRQTRQAVTHLSIGKLIQSKHSPKYLEVSTYLGINKVFEIIGSLDFVV